jgi:hypothetical protein
MKYNEMSANQKRDRIDDVLCTLPEARWPEVQRALLTGCGFEDKV